MLSAALVVFNLFLIHKITVIGNEMGLLKSRFANVWSQQHGSNFYPLEVVGRGSETQPQVGEHLNCIYYANVWSQIKHK